jgi:hypothetical protein
LGVTILTQFLECITSREPNGTKQASQEKRDFDPRNSLPISARVGKSWPWEKQKIFGQGDAANAVFIQKGKVTLRSYPKGQETLAD